METRIIKMGIYTVYKIYCGCCGMQYDVTTKMELPEACDGNLECIFCHTLIGRRVG